MRFLAFVRHIFRRMRFLMFFVGIALSALLLGVYLYGMNDEFLFYPDTLTKFVILNPPAIVPLVSYGRHGVVAMFATSVVWWLFIAVLFRRRRALPLEVLRARAAKPRS